MLLETGTSKAVASFPATDPGAPHRVMTDGVRSSQESKEKEV